MDSSIKKYQNAKIVKIAVLVFIAAIVLVWCIFCINKLHISTISPDKYRLVNNYAEGYMSNVDNVQYKGDKISNTKDYIELNGWVISANENMERATIDVVLMNVTTGVYYKVPTVVCTRPDVTEAYGVMQEKNFDWSGFQVKLPYNKKIDPFKYDYEIMVLLRVNGGETVMVDTGTTMRGKK